MKLLKLLTLCFNLALTACNSGSGEPFKINKELLKGAWRVSHVESNGRKVVLNNTLEIYIQEEKLTLITSNQSKLESVLPVEYTIEGNRIVTKDSDNAKFIDFLVLGQSTNELLVRSIPTREEEQKVNVIYTLSRVSEEQLATSKYGVSPDKGYWNGSTNSVGVMQRAFITIDAQDKNGKPLQYKLDEEIMSNDYESLKSITCFYDEKSGTLHAGYNKYKTTKGEDNKVSYESESSFSIRFTAVKLNTASEKALSQDLMLSSYYLHLESDSKEKTYYWAGYSTDKNNCNFKLTQVGKSLAIEGECASVSIHNNNDRSSEFTGKLQTLFSCQLM